jgi:Do/DeqQ family serine protease
MKKMVKNLGKTGGIMLIALAAVLLGSYAFKKLSGDENVRQVVVQSSGNQARLVNLASESSAASTDFVTAAEISVPAVVHVKTVFEMNSAAGSGYNPFREFFWGDRGYSQRHPSVGTGSGVIISDDGYIVTNNHVVDNASQVEVALNDKRTFVADVIGTDPSTDIALLKVDAVELPFLVFGNSDEVRVGEWVLAVGNPFNLTSTVTAGIVSAKGRNINILPDQQFPIESFIQTDAAVNPGNSGGALVATNGSLIGINTAIASNTGAYTGYSFAVPVNIVQKVVYDLMEYGSVQRAFIGVNIRDIDSKLAEEKDVKTLSGVYVAGLTEGGAASESGIKEGDVITSVNGVRVKSSPELQEQVSRYRPGDKVKVTLIRGESEKTVNVILRNKNGNTGIVKNDMVSVLGARFETVSGEQLNELGIRHGVQVTELNSGKLRSAGIREGFIIQSIDKRKVSSAEDISLALKDKKGGVLIEGIYPNGMRAYYGFGL